MKKYVIKNADGSEQYVMQAVHDSREDADKTILHYLFRNIGDRTKHADKNSVSPFDFILEEVEYADVNKTITSFERARKSLGLYPNEMDVVAQKRALLTEDQLTDIRKFVSEFNRKDIKALIALNRLFTITRAWNKEDGFIPNFLDGSQIKYYPYFVYDRDAAKFILGNAGNTVCCDALCLNRICFKSEVRAKQFGEQFIDLFNQILLK